MRTIYRFVCVLSLFFMGIPLFAQHESHASPGSMLQLQVIVDGAKRPDLIPGDLAYHHFFLAVAERPSPSALEKDRQLSRLAPIGLSAGDLRSLTAELEKFRSGVEQISQRRAQLQLNPRPASDMSTPPELIDLKAQEDSLVSATLVNLRAFLTPEGASRLDRHVQTQVKTHIVILGNPQ